MKSKLRILAITLIMVLSFGLVSVNAEATRYYIYVNGTELTSENASVTAGNGTVSYNAETKELTLNNATINSTMNMSGYSSYGVISITDSEDVTIKLVGTNTITNTGDSRGIHAHCNLAITGSGSLTIDTVGNGIFAEIPANSPSTAKDVTVKDTTLNVKSSAKDGIYCGNLVIDNSAVDLKAPARGCGAISVLTSSVTFNNIEIADKKVLQASYDPITASTTIIDPSTFAKADNYNYVKISNLYNVTAEWDVNSTVALESAGPSSGDAGKILVIDGDTVTATIGTADGYKIKSVLVNGKESKDSVKDGKLTFTVNGDTSIKVVSEAKEKSPNTGDEAGLYTIIAMLALLGATATVKLSGKNN